MSGFEEMHKLKKDIIKAWELIETLEKDNTALNNANKNNFILVEKLREEYKDKIEEYKDKIEECNKIKGNYKFLQKMAASASSLSEIHRKNKGESFQVKELKNAINKWKQNFYNKSAKVEFLKKLIIDRGFLDWENLKQLLKENETSK